MNKTERQNRKNKSTRNRHNGRINADKQHVLDNGLPFFTANGQEYRAILSKYVIPNTLHPDEPFEGIKSRIVKV